jgi:acylphosphatase
MTARTTGNDRLVAVVHGLVQGVFFRYNTKLQAEGLGVVGSVRNCPDGTVEVVAEGTRQRLEDLLSWLRRGPEAARVKRVDVRWGTASDTYLDFRIVR